MSCDQIEKISLLIDGELSGTDALAIERHLVTCTECQQARTDFLGLRSQIITYTPQLDSLATQRALDQIVSNQPAASAPKTGSRPWRSPFVWAFGAQRFNPALAAALVLLVFGAAAFVVYRMQRDTVTKDQQASTKPVTTSSPSSSPDSGATETEDQIAGNLGRKPSKTQQPETGSGSRKPNLRNKPPRERSAPKPLPQLQRYQAPPTFAEVIAPAGSPNGASVRPAGAQMMTARHLEQSELLLRAFRNIRSVNGGRSSEIAYERRRAQQLLYQNILLRREADNSGDVQVATLLGSLEPILLDIANLRDKPDDDEVRAIRDRMERKSLVALLQVSSTAVARTNE
ncbi:MAG: zf-HC2 domain-containing protein [Pyrinomonadaceae bacterium]